MMRDQGCSYLNALILEYHHRIHFRGDVLVRIEIHFLWEFNVARSEMIVGAWRERISHAVIEISGKRRDEACKRDRKSTRLNSSHVSISYAVFCLKKKT